MIIIRSRMKERGVISRFMNSSVTLDVTDCNTHKVCVALNWSKMWSLKIYRCTTRGRTTAGICHYSCMAQSASQDCRAICHRRQGTDRLTCSWVGTHSASDRQLSPTWQSPARWRPRDCSQKRPLSSNRSPSPRCTTRIGMCSAARRASSTRKTGCHLDRDSRTC